MPEMVHFGDFLKPETCGQTVLPDRSISFGLNLVENAKIENLKCDFLGEFQTLTYCEVSRFLALKFKYSTLTGVGGTCDQTSNAVLGARLCGTIFQTLGGAMNAANAVCGKDRYNFN